jgi:hypothetical protein
VCSGGCQLDGEVIAIVQEELFGPVSGKINLCTGTCPSGYAPGDPIPVFSGNLPEISGTAKFSVLTCKKKGLSSAFLLALPSFLHG